MNKVLQILVYSFLSITTTYGQIDYELTGYFVNYPIYQKPAKELSQLLNLDESISFDISRFRIRPTLYIGDKSRLNIEYELNTLYTNSSSILTDVTSTESKHQVLDLSWNVYDNKKFMVNHFIDRLYFKHSFKFASITLGRQRIAWGTGRIWNPIDLFNPLNPTNFAKTEKDGADAVSIKWNVGNFTDLEIVYAATKKIQNSNVAARFRSNIGEYDFSIISGRMDKNFVLGGDLAGNLLDAGLRAEILFTDRYIGNTFIKYIIGIDYQFTSKLYALCEFKYNGEGTTKKSEYVFTKLLRGETMNLAKNYFNITATYLMTPLFAVSASSTFNLDDNSGYIAASGEYSLSEAVYLALGSQISYGEKLTEYWFLPNSYYIKLNFYF